MIDETMVGSSRRDARRAWHWSRKRMPCCSNNGYERAKQMFVNASQQEGARPNVRSTYIVYNRVEAHIYKSGTYRQREEHRQAKTPNAKRDI